MGGPTLKTDSSWRELLNVGRVASENTSRIVGRTPTPTDSRRVPAGHLRVIERAASQGDRLVVGVSSDALNLSKKGRDHGLGTYNDTRMAFGLSPASSFAEVTTDPAVQAAMEAAYGAGNVGPDLGQGYIVDSFMVVVLGGVGQLAGTVYAALGLGVLNKLLEGLSGAVLAKIMVLMLIVIFIQKRPQGIFALKGRFADS